MTPTPQPARRKEWVGTFKDLFDEARRDQRRRILKAGKHKCVKIALGVARRVTQRNGEPLKRPVVVMRFYKCKICGRNMTPKNQLKCNKAAGV